MNSKKHGTTEKIPLQELAAEDLNPLPPQELRNRYRWEDRRISKDGFVSFDGHLYGVDWRYSGREAQVRLYQNHVQVCVDNLPVADIPLSEVKGYYVPQKTQYSGLETKEGIAYPRAAGIQMKEDVVKRPLALYDRLMEVVSNA